MGMSAEVVTHATFHNVVTKLQPVFQRLKARNW